MTKVDKIIELCEISEKHDFNYVRNLRDIVFNEDMSSDENEVYDFTFDLHFNAKTVFEATSSFDVSDNTLFNIYLEDEHNLSEYTEDSTLIYTQLIDLIERAKKSLLFTQ